MNFLGFTNARSLARPLASTWLCKGWSWRRGAMVFGSRGVDTMSVRADHGATNHAWRVVARSHGESSTPTDFFLFCGPFLKYFHKYVPDGILLKNSP
jgi:hypothetical protein